MAKEKDRRWKIAIVGGGASGMMSAITAAINFGNGNEMILLEKNNLLGKKLLATGNGRCNFMNQNCTPFDLPSQKGGFPSPEEKEKDLFSSEALSQLGPEKTERFFLQMGVLAREEAEGRIYPYSGQGSVIKEALEAELFRLAVSIYKNCNVKEIRKTGDFFELKLESGKLIFASKVILATGGKAGLQYGSTGDGYMFAKTFGHSIIKPIPALVPLLCGEAGLEDCKGVRAKGKVALRCDGKIIAEDTGEIQFTKDGISGICVFNVSRYVRFKSMNEMSGYSVVLDLLPEYSQEDLLSLLMKKQNRESESSTHFFLKGLIHEKLAIALLKQMKIGEEELAYKITHSQMKTLAFLLKNWELKITGTKSFKEAQVTCGGVDTKEIHPGTMESLLAFGLYFAGELVDVDGRCGGYNLQWAWSSGYEAGMAAAKE